MIDKDNAALQSAKLRLKAALSQPTKRLKTKQNPAETQNHPMQTLENLFNATYAKGKTG